MAVGEATVWRASPFHGLQKRCHVGEEESKLYEVSVHSICQDWRVCWGTIKRPLSGSWLSERHFLVVGANTRTTIPRTTSKLLHGLSMAGSQVLSHAVHWKHEGPTFAHSKGSICLSRACAPTVLLLLCDRGLVQHLLQKSPASSKLHACHEFLLCNGLVRIERLTMSYHGCHFCGIYQTILSLLALNSSPVALAEGFACSKSP